MENKQIIRGVGIGAGYFSHYQYDSWNQIPQVKMTALSNRTQSKTEAIMTAYNINRYYENYQEMIDKEQPDFVDIITPPETHYAMCKYAAARGVHIICQKPLAPTYEESVEIVNLAREANVRFMVHENWRWQPWYREIKRLIDDRVLGEVFTLNFNMRTGDGWGDDAYLARQPFFRSYPRLLVYETGVHFIDTFRYLLGEIQTVYARLRQLNPVIRGEDSGQIVFGFHNEATAILDANRYNEVIADNPRFTFGNLRLDGSKGHLLLDNNGDIYIKPLGQAMYRHEYAHEDRGFAGDCVHHLQRHFVESFLSGEPFESTGLDYLKTIKVVEACYDSAASGEVVRLAS
ncbi:MAG: Gfo/Idh/MocA family oxidoreductase [Chloroflexota bacterium]